LRPQILYPSKTKHFMKKFLLLASIVSLSLLATAQRGNNQIGIALEVGVPMGDFGDAAKTGFGGLIRGAYGIGTAGHVTLTTGYLSFRSKADVEDALGADKVSYSIVPILAGYRHNFSGLYIEPQVGYGSYGAKVKGGLFDGSDSEGAFTWGGGLGYEKNGIEIGARIQAASKDGSTTSFIGFHIGYNFGSASKE
jgi:hypothetical protein